MRRVLGTCLCIAEELHIVQHPLEPVTMTTKINSCICITRQGLAQAVKLQCVPVLKDRATEARMSGQLHAFAALFKGEDLRHPLDRSLGSGVVTKRRHLTSGTDRTPTLHWLSDKLFQLTHPSTLTRSKGQLSLCLRNLQAMKMYISFN